MIETVLPATSNTTRLLPLMKAAEVAGLELLVPEPTCCRGCVDIETPDGPYLWVFLADGELNERTYWQKGSTESTGDIYYNAPETGFDGWMNRVCDALSAEGFLVGRPASPNASIEVAVRS